MRSGALYDRVTFQTKTEVSDGISAGGTETWTDTLSDVPAAIWPIKGAEAIEAMKIEHTVTHRVRVRLQAGITADMRIEWGSKYLDIISLRDLGRRRQELEILATELTT